MRVVKCKLCGRTIIRNRRSVKNGKARCDCQLNARLIDRTGEVFNEIKILKEFGGCLVLTQCMRCGEVKERQKGRATSRKAKCRCTTGLIADSRLEN